VTVRPPKGASAATFSVAIAVVEFTTVTSPGPPAAAPPTEIPAPKLAWVAPCTKFVSCPVIVTTRFCWPCLPVPGFTDEIVAPGSIVREALFELAKAPPVVVVPETDTR
jgi:hypothetical protein